MFLARNCKDDETGRECDTHGGERHTGFDGVKRARKGTLGRHRREWEGNIAMDLEEIGCEGVELDFAVGRHKRWILVKAVVSLRGTVMCGEFLD